MAKYSKGAQKSVAAAMKKMEKGTLKSGNSNKKVTSKKQAIAIGLSEAKKKGAKVPAKKSATSKKSVAKKAAPKKAVAKKVVPKKSVTKKPVAKKTAPKKAVAKKTPAKKSVPKKAASPKAVAKKSKPITKSIPVKQSVNDPVPTPSPMPEVNNEAQAPPVQDGNIVNAPAVKDPITSTDQNVYNKATSKMDPKHNMPVSSTRKGGIKPSGKKPMW